MVMLAGDKLASSQAFENTGALKCHLYGYSSTEQLRALQHCWSGL